MKQKLLTFAAIAMMVGFSANVMAQEVTATEPNDANAQILAGIALSATQDLEFGGIVPDATGGTVVMDAADNRSTAAGMTLVTTSISPLSGAYTVTGGINTNYAITIPTASVSISNGAETMTVTAMTCSYADLTSTFSAGGTDSFKVGGTLTLAANQAFGVYTGAFNVTVAY